jgi:putative transposase
MSTVVDAPAQTPAHTPAKTDVRLFTAASLRESAPLPRRTALAMREPEHIGQVKTSKQMKARARQTLVTYVLQTLQAQPGLSGNKAIDQMEYAFERGALPLYLMQAMRDAAPKGRECIKRSALFALVKKYKEAEDGLLALVPRQKGSVNRPKAWWADAVAIYNAPGKTSMRTVARELQRRGHVVSYDQVRNYLTDLPAQLGKRGVARTGAHLHALKEAAYQPRHTHNLAVGALYAADGYRADIVIAHPKDGSPWRPELTAAMDVRSRHIVAVSPAEHEGTSAVQQMWVQAIVQWGHVPPSIKVDNGSGHSNHLMCDSVTGFYDRMGITPNFALPGNPHGKGWIERFFRTMSEDFLKVWRPELYRGPSMAPDALNQSDRDIKKGLIQLPSLAQFMDALNNWLAHYHQWPHPEDKSQTIAQMWAQLKPVPPDMSAQEMMRQQKLLTVARGMLRHDGMLYKHPDLMAFNGAKVIFEYDNYDNAVGVVYRESGEWVCDAALVGSIDVMPPSRAALQEQNRTDSQLRRLEVKKQKALSKSRQVIDADATAMGVIDMAPATPLLQDTSDDDITLDLTAPFYPTHPQDQEPDL